MKKKFYKCPSVQVIDVKIEKGFANSNLGDPDVSNSQMDKYTEQEWNDGWDM